MPINFGLLNTQPVQPSTQVVQVPNYGLLNAQAAMQGMQTGANIGNQMQENRRANALLPGQLQEQQAQIGVQQAQTGLLKSQTTGENLKNTQLQREVMYQKNADDAYHNVMQKGGTTNTAIDAYQSQLAPDTQTAFQTNRQALQLSVSTGNAKSLELAAGATAATITAYNATQDPKEQQNLLKNLNIRLDKIDPNHIEIKNKQDLHNYGILSIGTAMDPKTQAQIQYEYVQKPQIEATAKSQGDITTHAVQGAVDDAQNAPKILATQQAYDSMGNQINQWNVQHPDLAISTGPGTDKWIQIKQKAAAAGVNIQSLDKLEALQAAHDSLVQKTLGTLKTMPRSENVVNIFTKALSDPSDTQGTAQVKSQIVRYGAAMSVGYADFLQKYKDAHQNSITGAQAQWSNFLASDPTILKGDLPDSSWITPDNYEKFIDPNYAITQELNGKTYVLKNGQWYNK